jgi:hypothetical protein
MDFATITATAGTTLTLFGLKILGALLAWIVGRYLIGLTVRLVSRALSRQNVDSTLLRYVGNVVSVALNVVLVVAILGYFGVETTSFAALVAAMGIAIGAAWAGLLANRGRLVSRRPAAFQSRRLHQGRRGGGHGKRGWPVRHHDPYSGQRQQLRG